MWALVCLFRSLRAVQAALACTRKAADNLKLLSRPRVVIVSDTPSLVKEIAPDLNEFAEASYFTLIVVNLKLTLVSYFVFVMEL